jgi:hypothetical protein
MLDESADGTCDVVSEYEHAGWREADRQLRRIAARRAALDAEEARWLVIARRERVHEQLGYGSFREYVERIRRCCAHAADERIRVADKLVRLPTLLAALSSGDLAFTGVRELSRIVTPRTEGIWVDRARGKTVREIEKLVAGRKHGDLPDTPAGPELQQLKILPLRVEPDVYAMFLETRRTLEAEVGGALDDSALLATLCERALRGADDSTTRPRHQIALTICERCDAATQDAAGQVIDVPASVVERARCDAQHVGRIDAATPDRLVTDIPEPVRRLVERRDHHRCTVPGCRASRFLEIHHIVPRDQGGDHSLANLTLLCGAHHRARHNNKLRVTGHAPDQLEFRHADGTPYGADCLVEARAALLELGCSASEASIAIERAASHVGPEVELADFITACALASGRSPPAEAPPARRRAPQPPA